LLSLSIAVAKVGISLKPAIATMKFFCLILSLFLLYPHFENIGI